MEETVWLGSKWYNLKKDPEIKHLKKENERLRMESDITYIWNSTDWLYLAVVINPYNREIVGWSINERINWHLVIRATRMAIWQKKPAKGLIFHSDRGSQYCSNDFKSYIQWSHEKIVYFDLTIPERHGLIF
ncbi:MAG: hypothetical protein CSB34_03085 [Desulfobulbus propionicus]|nr:MAG: hypothetical protein CSB34_03085 [Desulfobulbus propionicus]